jgi:HemY protein
LTRNGDIKRSARVLEAAWKLSPHPEIAEAYARVRPGDSTLDRLNRVKELIRVRAHHAECAFAVANAALDAKDYAAAREAMKPLLAAGPTRRACLLMADIEEAEHNDEGKIREWLSRAVRAPRDATWVADGFVSDHWAPVSPVTGRLDAFEWKVPPEDVTASPLVLPETPAPEPEPTKVVTQIEAPKPAEEPATTAVAAAPTPAPPPNPPAQDTVKTATVVTITPPPQAANTSAVATPAPAATGSPTRASRPVSFPLDHAPDDPGPSQASHEASDADTRFRLFS